MAETYDVIVIGGGHNGLTTAAYLAKGGEKAGKNKLKVLVLERYKKVGGAARLQVCPIDTHAHTCTHIYIYIILYSIYIYIYIHTRAR